VVSKAPLREIINNSDATGLVTKWAIELATFDIDYRPRTAIKSQALANFVADWTEAQDQTPVPEPEHWTLHFDGSKTLEGSGAGVVLTSPQGDKLSYVLQIHFATTNNVAEYEALLHGLRIAKDMGISRIMCYDDSDLVAWQVSGTCDAKDPNMAAYRDTVDKMAQSYIGYEVNHIKRADNDAADTLSRLGSSRKVVPADVFLEHLHVSSVKGINQEYPEASDSPLQVMVVTPDWMVPFLNFL
jgi:ribonuclease HI